MSREMGKQQQAKRYSEHKEAAMGDSTLLPNRKRFQLWSAAADAGIVSEESDLTSAAFGAGS